MVLSLLQNGFEVLAHSSDSNRSKKLLAKCRSFDPQVAGRLRVTTSLVKGVHVRHWVVGKSDRKVLDYVPQGAKAVVFSVPNPFESGRRDVLVLPGGILHMDLTKLSKPRQFSNLLEDHDPQTNLACLALLFAAPSQDVGRPQVIAGENALIGTNVN